MTDRIDISFDPGVDDADSNLASGESPGTKYVGPTGPTTVHRAHPFWVAKARIAIIAVAAVLVIRAVFLEPFGVPTGSTAPTILGVHRSGVCPNCGWPIRVGEPPEATHASFFEVTCPNCGAAQKGLGGAPPTPGDRLLVDKSAFDWRSPRRWEIVVFRVPNDPDRPFIKRVVGLPGETVRLVDGDVVIDGRLVRKSLAQCRAVAVPIYRMSCRPAEGWEGRWHAEPAAAPPVDHPGPNPAGPHVDDTDLVFPAGDGKWRGLAFRGLRNEPIGDAVTYNGRRSDIPVEWVHDFMVTCDVVVRSGAGEITIALNDGADEAVLTLSVRDGISLSAGKQKREAADLHPEIGQPHRVEFAFVDRCASVHWDGKPIVEPIELPQPDYRLAVTQPLRIGTRGVDAVVSNLRLDRDLHYGAAGRLGFGQCRLGSDEYFVLGDNSANSEDSRFWSQPGVPAHALLGKPLLLYAPSRWRTWTALGRSWDVQAIDEGRFGWIR